MNGKGEWIFEDGTKYVGEFKNNLMHGEGTYISEDETRIYKG